MEALYSIAPRIPPCLGLASGVLAVWCLLSLECLVGLVCLAGLVGLGGLVCLGGLVRLAIFCKLLHFFVHFLIEFWLRASLF